MAVLSSDMDYTIFLCCVVSCHIRSEVESAFVAAAAVVVSADMTSRSSSGVPPSWSVPILIYLFVSARPSFGDLPVSGSTPSVQVS